MRRAVLAVLASTLFVGSCDTPLPTSGIAAGYKIQSVSPTPGQSIILTGGDTAFSAREDGSFQATSIADGHTYWSAMIDRPGFLMLRIATAGDRIFLGAGGGVKAISRTNGAVLWRFTDAALTMIPEAGIDTDGRYVAFAQRYGLATVLDAQTGARVWQRRLLPHDINNWITAPVFVDSVLVYSRRPRVGVPPKGEAIAFAVRAATGDSLWTLQTDSAKGLKNVGGIRSLRFGDGLFFGTNDGSVLYLGANSGDIRWRNPSPAVNVDLDTRDFSSVDHELVTISSTIPGRVVAVNTSTGAANWILDSCIGSAATRPGVNARTVVYTAFGGQLAIFDRQAKTCQSIYAVLSYCNARIRVHEIWRTPSRCVDRGTKRERRHDRQPVVECRSSRAFCARVPQWGRSQDDC